MGRVVPREGHTYGLRQPGSPDQGPPRGSLHETSLTGQTGGRQTPCQTDTHHSRSGRRRVNGPGPVSLEER